MKTVSRTALLGRTAYGGNGIVSLLRKVSSSAVVWSYATTALRFGGLFLVLPVVLRTVPEDQLGFFYLFQTFAVISALLDAGVGPTVSRSVSFAWAGAERLERRGHQLLDQATSTGPNWDLLTRILHTFSRFYLGGAFLLFVVLGLGCLPFIWSVTSSLTNPTEGRWIWMFFVLGSAWNFANSIWPSMLGGMNRVKDQQVAQLISIAVGYAVTVGGLLAGWQLWALALSGFVQAVVLRHRARSVCMRVAGEHFRTPPRGFDRDLFATVWPASWRTGVLWAAVSVYLSIPVFLTTKFGGLEEAAQMGLAVQLAMTVCQVASVAVLVKIPQFSIMRIRGEQRALLDLFSERISAYLFLVVIGSAAVLLLGDWILHDLIGSKTPLPPFTVLATLLVWGAIEGVQALFRGVALSANDPQVWVPVVCGACVTSSSSILAIAFATTWWLPIMVVTKFIALDVPVIRIGMRALCADFKAVRNSFADVPRRLLAQLCSHHPTDYT